MKITIRKEVTKVETKEVNVVLKSAYDGGVILTVDEWEVFKLNPNGTGRLIGNIGSWANLPVDKNGRIILEN